MAEMMELSGWKFKTTLINRLRVLRDEVDTVQEQMTNVRIYNFKEKLKGNANNQKHHNKNE